MISIVIPSYNEEKYIGRCLEALTIAIDLTNDEAEIILVDNGSSDSTKKIAESFGCNIIDQPIGNISKLRNIGAQNANGSIIGFLDSDCLVDQNWLKFCVENFNREKIAVVGTRAIPDLVNATWVEKAWYRLVSGAERPDFVDWLGTSNILVKKDVFMHVGGFNETLETGEDVDLSYRIGRNNLICLEKRINTIHLRESKTLYELFCRELWRGQSSIRSFIRNRYRFKELPSILIPMCNLSMLFLAAIFSFFKYELTIFPLIIMLTTPFLFMVRKRVGFKYLYGLMQCYIIALVYSIARAFSIIKELFLIVRYNWLKKSQEKHKY
jgi:glycosyltransferase involved in cell wall biosynthesis